MTFLDVLEVDVLEKSRMLVVEEGAKDDSKQKISPFKVMTWRVNCNFA